MDEELDDVNGAWRASDGKFWLLPHRRFRADGREPLERDRLLELVNQLTATLSRLSSESARDDLRAIRRAREQLDAIEHEAVALARSYGWAWRDVGDALGMSRSAVHKRFARAETRPRRRPNV